MVSVHALRRAREGDRYRVQRWLSRSAAIVLVALLAIYLPMVVVPSFAGGLDRLSLTDLWDGGWCVDGVPLYGCNPSSNAAAAMVGLLSVLCLHGGIIPLGWLIAEPLRRRPAAFHPGERLGYPVLIVVAVIVVVITYRAAAAFAVWFID